MKVKGLIFVALFLLLPTVVLAGLFSDLKDKVKDELEATLTEKPKQNTQKAAPKPKTQPTPVVKKSPDPKPTAQRSKPGKPLNRQGIIELQQCLNKKGFNAGGADGVIGRKTIAAAREFKKSVIAEQGKTGQIAITDDIDEGVLIGCKFAGFGKTQVLKGSLPVTRSRDGKPASIVWEAKKQFGSATVMYYFPANSSTGRFRFKSSKIRYHCENGVVDESTPNGAFRKKNNSAFHSGICGGKKGELLRVTYAP